jgi:asparagine synthase (glutamine-hydrolysing)
MDIKQYWDLDGIPVKNIPYSDACSLLKEKLLESVKIRLMSEVPLGVFLSGGLDSGAIVALMAELVTNKIKTFSVGYRNEPESSELEYARIVARRFNTEHHEFFLTPDGLLDSIDTFLEHSEEPLVESAGIALYKLAKLAKPLATVLLSGEGADEIMAGYPIYSKMKYLEGLHRIYKFMPKVIVDNLLNGNDKPEKMTKYFDWLKEPFCKRYRSMSFDLSGSIKERMYTPHFKDILGSAFEDYYISLHDKITRESMLRKMLYIDTKSWLAEDILLKSDRMTMAASVELRAPFLDQELMEFAYSLPDEYKLQGNTGKFILRDIMKDSLPGVILKRKKKGFPVPLTSWFSGELQARTKSLLTSERSLGRGYFNPVYIHSLFTRINRGEDLGRRFFSLVTLELWHRKYID